MSPSISFSSETSTTRRKSSIYTNPEKKQKMSITQTYFLAHSARGKLSKEASRADHDLRLLVGHANMLDSLMIDLANAEQEQERWFNRSLSGARDQEEEHSTVEEPEADWEAEDAESTDDSDSDSEEGQFHIEELDDEEDDSLALTRTVSRHSPPQLAMDEDSESEDEHMPPSPPNLSLDNLTSTKDLSQSQSFEADDFYLPSRQQPIIIAAY